MKLTRKLVKEIKLKEAELTKLKKDLEAEKCKDYLELVGKYLIVSPTCCIRVDHIDYITENFINVIGLKAQADENDFEIHLAGAESIWIYGKITTTTKEFFLEFISDNYEKMLKKLKTKTL